MTDQEIDFELALAIGYAPDRVRDTYAFVQVLNDQSRLDGCGSWQSFDHKDPSVIWPIAARYDAFPFGLGRGEWAAYYDDSGIGCYSKNPATATALAVIAGGKKGKL